ncbi:MAG: D-alanine--D-alanine ligase [Firmicutes bacterium]|nr:D-alanine--D-alanine ligase [Bacillota bacterium]
MENIAVLFGGRSCEHDISVITAMQAIHALDKAKYSVIPVYIGIDGDFYTGAALLETAFYRKPIYKRLKKAYFCPPSGLLHVGKRRKPLYKIDAAIVAMHGLNGEDGTIASLMELCAIPYTSCGVAAAAVTMDKILMKSAFKGAGLPVLPSVAVSVEEFGIFKKNGIGQAENELGYPMIVKPANLGSSIGIKKCADREALYAALAAAFCFDERAIVERAVDNLTEINCSGLGRGADVAVSECERPVSWNEILTFEDKYLSGGKGGMKDAGRIFPADIPKEQSDAIKEMTEKAFGAFNCKGVIRADFIIDNADGAIYINEINSIPGSLSFYLWEREGLDFTGLLNKLIKLAKFDRQMKDALTYSYSTPVLHAKGGMKSK